MLKVLNERERVSLYVATGVIISALCFNFIIAPIWNRNYILNKDIRISRAKLRKYLRLLSQKESIQNKYDKFSSTLKIYDEAQDTSVAALLELENLAKDANIRILDIRPQARLNNPRDKEIIMDLRTEGLMDNYLKFIYNIENSPSLLRMKRCQLTAKPNTPNLEGIFSISQSLSTPE